MAKKKPKKDIGRLPAYSVYPPEDAPSADIYAYDLIKLFGGAMEALNGGILPMPTHWREHLEDILNFHKVGKPPDPQVAAKHVETRKIMILDDMERERGEVKQQSRIDFLEELAETRGYHNSAQIYRDTKPYEVRAISSIVSDRIYESDHKEREAKIEKARQIKDRLEKGESLNQIFSDADSESRMTILDHQINGTPLEGHEQPKTLTDWEKAIRWMSDGMNLCITTPGNPRYITPDKEVEKVIKTVIQRNERKRKRLKK